MLIGNSNFNPDLQYKLTMSVGGILMVGWTSLLIWGVQSPVERRFVILITAFPVVFGMFFVSLIAYISGNPASLWIVLKTAFLFVTMFISYFLSSKIAKDNNLV
jgi:phosphoglycerol transferase MdoB-like AlkP superfamily enzyme